MSQVVNNSAGMDRAWAARQGDIAQTDAGRSGDSSISKLKQQLQNVSVRSDSGCLPNAGSGAIMLQTATKSLGSFFHSSDSPDRSSMARAFHGSSGAESGLLDALMSKLERANDGELANLKDSLHFSRAKDGLSSADAFMARTEVLAQFALG